jgi:hypothetical protein
VRRAQSAGQAVCSQGRAAQAAQSASKLSKRSMDVGCPWKLHADSIEINADPGQLIETRSNIFLADCSAVMASPKFEELDLLRLPNYSIYLKLISTGHHQHPSVPARLHLQPRPNLPPSHQLQCAAQHIVAVQHLFCFLDSSRTSWDIAKRKGFKSGWHDK